MQVPAGEKLEFFNIRGVSDNQQVTKSPQELSVKIFQLLSFIPMSL